MALRKDQKEYAKLGCSIALENEYLYPDYPERLVGQDPLDRTEHRLNREEREDLDERIDVEQPQAATRLAEPTRLRARHHADGRSGDVAKCFQHRVPSERGTRTESHTCQPMH